MLEAFKLAKRRDDMQHGWRDFLDSCWENVIYLTITILFLFTNVLALGIIIKAVWFILM